MAAWVGFAVLIIVAPAWLGAGRLAQRAKMPMITGYVIAGLLCGPSFLSLLNAEGLESLIAVDQGCLAIIALMAGAEVMFSDVQRIKRQVRLGLPTGSGRHDCCDHSILAVFWQCVKDAGMAHICASSMSVMPGVHTLCISLCTDGVPGPAYGSMHVSDSSE